MQVPSLGWEDALDESLATHSSILGWRIPWTEEPGGLYSPWGRGESDTMEALSTPALNLSAVRKETLLCLLVVYLVLTECPST